MGLCKCPKKRVTNQFCFEHRVNVCEHCMVTNHPKCVVQSYLSWLHDHDYDPVCTLCSKNLIDGDCVRLTCYHMFHWVCLDKHARSLPATTAPAGYVCSTCQTCVFPQAQLVSPVADVLREKLAGVNWGRIGIGLPLLSDDREQRPSPGNSLLQDNTPSYSNHMPTATSRTSSVVNSSNSNLHNVHSNSQSMGPPYSIVNIESSLSSQGSRKVCEAYDDPKNVTFDHDENKYQRKSALEWFLRWWKLITRAQTRRRNTPGSIYKRYALLIFAGILIFIGIIILFSWLGKMSTDGDPSYDPRLNPLVNIERNKISAI